MRNPEITPDLAVGDFDSLSEEGEAYMRSLSDLEIIRLCPRKMIPILSQQSITS